MKLVYVTASLPYGPWESFIIPEIQALVKRGHEVRLVAMHPRGVLVHEDIRPLLPLAVTQPFVSLSILWTAMKEGFRAPGLACETLAWIFRSRSGSVLVNNLAIYAKGLWLARLARTSGVEHIHAHWAATTATMALVASKVSGIPFSITAHRYDILENNLLALKVEQATFIRFISENGYAMGKRLNIPALAAKSFVLHMGVALPLVGGQDLQAQAPNEGAGPLSQVPARIGRVPEPLPFTVLCPAHLLPVKGHRYLIEAMALLRHRGLSIQVLIAGDGPLRHELEKQVQDAGLSDTIRFLGQQSHDAILDLYAQHAVDAVVLPSIDLGGGEHEGLPVALVEAMAHERPVISTTTGGIPELLGHDAGLLVPPADAAALAEALARVVTDAALCQRLGLVARQKVEREFSIDTICATLERKFSSTP